MGKWLKRVKDNFPKTVNSHTDNTDTVPSMSVMSVTTSHMHAKNTVVCCNNCIHFTSDQIGDGAGIGKCTLGTQWTYGIKGRMPLFRYADRYCSKFKKE